MNFSGGAEYLIIGGGIAGVTAAETIRERDGKSAIMVVTDEPYPLYSRVLLPSYLKRRIPRAQVFMRKAADFAKHNIDFLPGSKVLRLDAARRLATLESGRELSYEKVLIATGGGVQPSPYDGLENVFRLQTIDDADRLASFLPAIQNPVVVGGSFIALEFLEIFSLRGIHPVLLLESARFFEKLVSPAGSEILERNMEAHGIRLLCRSGIQEVLREGNKVRGVIISDGTKLNCDALCLGIGLVPNFSFLEGSGISLGEKGILTDERLETSVPGVFAAGDVAEFQDMVLRTQHTVGNWNNAFLHGQAAGRALAGEAATFSNVPLYSIANLGLHIAVMGKTAAGFESLVRASSRPLSYEEYFLENGVIRGAVLINAAHHQPLFSRWIREGKNLASLAVKLQDPAVHLETLAEH